MFIKMFHQLFLFLGIFNLVLGIPHPQVGYEYPIPPQYDDSLTGYNYPRPPGVVPLVPENVDELPVNEPNSHSETSSTVGFQTVPGQIGESSTVGIQTLPFKINNSDEHNREFRSVTDGTNSGIQPIPAKLPNPGVDVQTLPPRHQTSTEGIQTLPFKLDQNNHNIRSRSADGSPGIQMLPEKIDSTFQPLDNSKLLPNKQSGEHEHRVNARSAQQEIQRPGISGVQPLPGRIESTTIGFKPLPYKLNENERLHSGFQAEKMESSQSTTVGIQTLPYKLRDDEHSLRLRSVGGDYSSQTSPAHVSEISSAAFGIQTIPGNPPSASVETKGNAYNSKEFEESGENRSTIKYTSVVPFRKQRRSADNEQIVPGGHRVLPMALPPNPDGSQPTYRPPITGTSSTTAAAHH